MIRGIDFYLRDKIAESVGQKKSKFHWKIICNVQFYATANFCTRQLIARNCIRVDSNDPGYFLFVCCYFSWITCVRLSLLFVHSFLLIVSLLLEIFFVSFPQSLFYYCTYIKCRIFHFEWISASFFRFLSPKAMGSLCRFHSNICVFFTFFSLICLAPHTWPDKLNCIKWTDHTYTHIKHAFKIADFQPHQFKFVNEHFFVDLNKKKKKIPRDITSERDTRESQHLMLQSVVVVFSPLCVVFDLFLPVMLVKMLKIERKKERKREREIVTQQNGHRHTTVDIKRTRKKTRIFCTQKKTDKNESVSFETVIRTFFFVSGHLIGIRFYCIFPWNTTAIAAHLRYCFCFLRADRIFFY